MGHQSYELLCSETTLSNHPVVRPKSSCDVHLLRSPWVKWSLHSNCRFCLLFAIVPNPSTNLLHSLLRSYLKYFFTWWALHNICGSLQQLLELNQNHLVSIILPIQRQLCMQLGVHERQKRCKVGPRMHQRKFFHRHLFQMKPHQLQ